MYIIEYKKTIVFFRLWIISFARKESEGIMAWSRIMGYLVWGAIGRSEGAYRALGVGCLDCKDCSPLFFRRRGRDGQHNNTSARCSTRTAPD